jgi:hypothetical protein
VSATHAFATPLPSHHEEQHTRPVEIVSSRAQRKARPKVFYALVTVAGLFALFMAQLLLSIVVSDGAYRIAGLQTEQRDLGRQEKSLSEQLDLLASPQNLATQAESLGMVLSNTAPVFLRLSDGAIVGAESAAGEGNSVIGSYGDYVPNELLGDIPLVTPAATDAATATQQATDAAVDPTTGETAVPGTMLPGATAATAATADAATTTGTTDPTTTTTGASTATGAPATQTPPETVTSAPGTLPAPVTR